MTMELQEMMDGSLLSEMIDQGYIKVQHHPADKRYRILNYTDKAVFDKVWNEATRQCRGLIIFNEAENTRAVVLARPFAKFFNYGEPEAATIGVNELVNVYDKADGSPGIMYPAPDGLPAIATRGSFASEQALHATALLRKRYPYYRLPRGVTPLVEIIYPENRIVLDYHGMDDLVHLGFVDIETGKTQGPTRALCSPFRMTQYFGTMPLHNALKMTHRKNAEGLVVRSTRNGEMVKVKQDDYLALHKIIFGLTERAVWERMKAMDSVEEICEGLPDEFHQWVKDVAGRLDKQWAEIYAETNSAYKYILVDPFAGDSRKEFALRAQRCKNPGLLFLLHDEKFDRLEEKIWDMIKPEHRPFSRGLADIAA